MRKISVLALMLLALMLSAGISFAGTIVSGANNHRTSLSYSILRPNLTGTNSLYVYLIDGGSLIPRIWQSLDKNATWANCGACNQFNPPISNNPWGFTNIAFDSAYWGKILYSMGGGARVFTFGSLNDAADPTTRNSGSASGEQIFNFGGGGDSIRNTIVPLGTQFIFAFMGTTSEYGLGFANFTGTPATTVWQVTTNLNQLMNYTAAGDSETSVDSNNVPRVIFADDGNLSYFQVTGFNQTSTKELVATNIIRQTHLHLLAMTTDYNNDDVIFYERFNTTLGRDEIFMKSRHNVTGTYSPELKVVSDSRFSNLSNPVPLVLPNNKIILLYSNVSVISGNIADSSCYATGISADRTLFGSPVLLQANCVGMNAVGKHPQAVSNSFIRNTDTVLFTVYQNSANNYVSNTTSIASVESTIPDPPVVQIQNPTGTVNSNNASINFTITSTNLNTSSCYYKLDAGSNVQLVNCANSSLVSTEGSHTLQVFASSNNGFEGSNTSSFNLSFVAPTVAIQSPAGTTTQSQDLPTYPMTLNFTAFDANGLNTSSCRYELNGAANVTITSCLNGTLTLARGTYTLKVFVSDIFGATGSATSSFTIQLAPRATGNTAAVLNTYPVIFGLVVLLGGAFYAFLSGRKGDMNGFMLGITVAIFGIILIGILSGLVTTVTSPSI